MQAGNETFGQIRKIGVRAVASSRATSSEYLIPNENLMINQVENWSYSSKNVRMHVPVGVSYDADMKLAEKLMLEAAKSCERVLKSPAADRLAQGIRRQLGQLHHPLLDLGPGRRRRQRPVGGAQEAVVAVQGSTRSRSPSRSATSTCGTMSSSNG